MNTNIAIIIPVYNEATVIKGVLRDVLDVYSNVICINDGSQDSTRSEVEKTKAIIINHPINLGQGAALQTGIEYALRDPRIQYFVTYDADGQHSLKDVAEMLVTIKKQDVDIVLGSRFLGSAENISALKKVILKLAIRFSNITTGLKLTDTHNGLRVFNRHVAENLNITLHGFSHASEIIERITEKQFKYTEQPVTIRYSDYSRAKGQSLYNAVNIAVDVLLNKLSK